MIAALALSCWIAATGAHFVLTAGAVRRTLGSEASFDEQAFATGLAGIGTLSVVLHIVAATTGLSLVAGLTSSCVWLRNDWPRRVSTAAADC